ncbi:MAG: ABC transporter ATP-binding protein [Tumebacillaceae bacterium]
MTDMAVTCQHVTKRYGQKRALDDLTLSLPAGRVVGILGANGSGKSSLFRMITGLTRPESGEINVLGGQPGWQMNGNIAYLPDRARWYPDHTVPRAFQWAESFLPGFDRKAAERLAEFMEMEMDVPAAGLSRGQEARLMLILCISRRVPLIILDEPFTGIDAPSRSRIIDGLIDQVSDGDRTVLISTHEIYEAEGLLDHVVFLKKGKVALAGEAEELRRQHGSMHSIMQTM